MLTCLSNICCGHPSTGLCPAALSLYCPKLHGLVQCSHRFPCCAGSRGLRLRVGSIQVAETGNGIIKYLYNIIPTSMMRFHIPRSERELGLLFRCNSRHYKFTPHARICVILICLAFKSNPGDAHFTYLTSHTVSLCPFASHTRYATYIPVFTNSDTWYDPKV